MASSSSDPMDDGSFRARVHKVFGSLPSSPAAASMSPALKPLWSLTDEEVEKREWNRSKGKDDDNILCSSSFDGLFKLNRDARPKGFGGDIGDLGGDEDGNRKGSDDDLSGDEDGDSTDVRQIRSSIGLDSTLDREEEEDEYDRLAEGKGKTSNGFRKDPRADQLAAQVRLKEDAAEAAKYKPNFSKPELSGENRESKAMSDVSCKLKPILKRKGNGEARSKKRVRFDPSFVGESEDTPERRPVFSDASLTKAQDSDYSFDENKPKVPDHLINPSKYTRYSLDSCSELNNETNTLACSYVLDEVKKWKQNLEAEEPSSTLPKSVTFVPKKKTNTAIVMEDAGEDGPKEFPNQPSFPVAIAAWEEPGGDTATEDDMQMDRDDDTGVCKPGRHYRTKSGVEDPVT